MKAQVTVTGTDITIRNLGNRGNLVKLALEQGLVNAGLVLQAQSMALAPVEFGDLKASAFSRQAGKLDKTVVTVGYTAAYALYVHELVGMVLKGQLRQPAPPHVGRYWDPQGRAQAKFLEAPFRAFQPQLLRIVGVSVRRVLI